MTLRGGVVFMTFLSAYSDGMACAGAIARAGRQGRPGDLTQPCARQAGRPQAGPALALVASRRPVGARQWRPAISPGAAVGLWAAGWPVSHTAMAAGRSWIRRYARAGNRISAAPTEIYSPSPSLRPWYP